MLQELIMCLDANKMSDLKIIGVFKGLVRIIIIMLLSRVEICMSLEAQQFSA